jgi:hypothetical protein
VTTNVVRVAVLAASLAVGPAVLGPVATAPARPADRRALTTDATHAASPPYASDADNDGLPDDWETTAGRAYGCDPHHADVIVYAVTTTTLTAQVDATIARAIKFFADLNVTNPDGRRGIHLFVIRGPKTTRTDSYADLKNVYLPKSLVGRAHFHVFSTDPGGQTCVECNASISGVQSQGWQSFVHELGHQLGLEHEALGFKVQSPLHASVMNYAYLSTFNGSEDNVQYSDGRFASLKMRETDLDETVPFPIASLEFLSKDPYHFSLKAVGNSTEVDWNRNGVFGEKHVRADINYASGSYLGDRVDVEKVVTAAVGVYRGNDFYLVYGVAGANNTRAILLRKWLGKTWGPRVPVGTGLIGDPTMAVENGVLWIASATASGTTAIVGLRPDGDGAKIDKSLGAELPNRPLQNPTLAVLDDHLWLFLRAVATSRLGYRIYSGTGGSWDAEIATDLVSKAAPGVAWNPLTRQAMIVTIKDANVPNRPVVNSRGLTNGRLNATGTSQMMGGATGGTATQARPAVFVDTTRDAGSTGRLYAYYMAGGAHDSAYFSMQIADRTFNDGWLERVAFDQWSTTASAPAAAMNPGGEIAYCYRNESDSVLKCSFHGTGVDEGEMGDADELTFIRTHGLKESLARTPPSRLGQGPRGIDPRGPTRR